MVAGLRAFVGGIGFILTTPAVWLYALVPALLLLVLGCGLSCAGVLGAAHLTDVMLGAPVQAWQHVGSWLLTGVLALLALWLAWLLALVLAQPLSGFALEAIARAQHHALFGDAPPPLSFGAALLLSLRITLTTLALGLPILVALSLLGLLFPPATAVTLPLKFLCGAWLLAWNFLDYPLGLRGLGMLARLGWVGRHFGAFSVFGLAWALLLLVPGIFLLVLPMGVAGAARLVAGSERRRLPRRRSVVWQDRPIWS
jgi:CysZ protein